MGTRIGVVMAGGSGERFWPLSRPDRPKQLLRLTHPEENMLEEAVHRLQPLFGEQVLVATSAGLAEAIAESGLVPPDRLLFEPAKRNTLGALCWLVANLEARGHAEATVAVVTADHKIGDADSFRMAIALAMEVAEHEGGIATIGIPPTRPETGYGYIEVEDPSASPVRARSFREKPSLESAREFVDSGRFLWNAGMFVFTLPAFWRELAHAGEATLATARALVVALREGDSARARSLFEDLPGISFDFAVMEHAATVHVIRAEFPWDDVGAWDAMERSFPLDEHGNVLQGRTVVVDSTGCVVVNDDAGRVVGILGLHDLVVVATKDAVLVCPKDQSQKVKEIVQRL